MKRKGNMLITIVVCLFSVLIVGSMTTITSKHKDMAITRAANAGRIESYIALANLCADLFRTELENTHYSLALTEGAHVEGIELDLSSYENALRAMQLQVTSPHAPAGGPAGSWLYPLSDPAEPLSYIGIDNDALKNYTDQILDGATIQIQIDAPLSLAYTVEEDLSFEDTDEMYLNDIWYTITLKKGTFTLVQRYRLSDEIFVAQKNMTLLMTTIDPRFAKTAMVSQTLTQRDLQVSTDIRIVDPSEVSYSILEQPVSQTASDGDLVAFTVTASRTGLSYRWEFKNNVSETVWRPAPFTGADTDTLQINAESSYDGMVVRCIVSDGAGVGIASDEATLAVS